MTWLDLNQAMNGESGIVSQRPDQPLAKSPETQLCVGCMAPNEPSAHFCAKCGAPLSSYAATGPFECLFAEGHVYRQAAERPGKLIVVLGIWLIFGMVALSGIAMIFASQIIEFWPVIIGAFMLFVSTALIWKTTQNYVSRGKAVKIDDHAV